MPGGSYPGDRCEKPAPRLQPVAGLSTRDPDTAGLGHGASYLAFEIGGRELGRPDDVGDALANSLAVIQQRLGA